MNSELVYRNVQVSSRLRPDFYQWWPNFTDLELLARVRAHGVVIGTQLTIANIERLLSIDEDCAKNIKSFFNKNFPEQSGLFCSMLNYAGIDQRVIDVFKYIPRELFVKKEFKKLSYLNASLPFEDGSWLTMPGLLLNMIQPILAYRFNCIIEIGAGSGFHLALLKSLLPDTNIRGYEINQLYAEFGRHALQEAGIRGIDIIPEAFNSCELSQKDTLFIFTNKVTLRELSEIVESVAEYSCLQIVHPICGVYADANMLDKCIDVQRYNALSFVFKTPAGVLFKPILHDVDFVK